MQASLNLTRRPLSTRWMLLVACGLAAANAAHAQIQFVGGTSDTAATFYLSQTYGELKDANGNTLASSGRVENSGQPLGAANQGGTLSAVGSTLTYSASVRTDGFALARAAASVNVSNAGANFGYNAVASQGSRTQVSFASSLTPGRVVFNFGLTGSASSPYGLALGRLDFLARPFQAGNGSFFDVFGSDALHAVGAGNSQFTYTGSTASPLDILFYAAAAVVIQDGAIVPAGANFSAFANFANTYDLKSIDLYTATGDTISDWTLTDEATRQVVFDQNGRVLAGAVPEPSSYALMGFGLVALLVAARRRAS